MNKISSSDKFIFLKLFHQLIKQEINQVNKIEFKTNLDKSKSCSVWNCFIIHTNSYNLAISINNDDLLTLFLSIKFYSHIHDNLNTIKTSNTGKSNN